MGVPLATRNVTESRTRLAISVGGIALAALLVLVLDGVFEGTQRQVTAYMDNVDFDVVVSQEGVRNLHMTTSFLPETVLDKVRDTPGVDRADPILYTTSFLRSGQDRSNAYIIGYRPGALGGPWERAGGSVPPPPGRIVIDERLAERWGVSVGERIDVGGKPFRVGGLTRGTVNVVNSIAFVRYADFPRVLDVSGVVSYVLVRTERGTSAETLAARLRRDLDGVTVQTRQGFSESERRIVGDMSVDIMWMMNLIGFLIGLAVVGLTVYTSTFSKLREYGVLKAVGAGNGQLFGIVLRQAAISIALAVLLALVVSLGIAAVLPLLGSGFTVVLAPASVLRVAVSAAAIGLLASAVPIVRISRLKPAEVFRR